MNTRTRDRGRPKATDPMKTIGIAFNSGTKDLADQIAADEGRSRSQVVRRAIRQYAETKETN